MMSKKGIALSESVQQLLVEKSRMVFSEDTHSCSASPRITFPLLISEVELPLGKKMPLTADCLMDAATVDRVYIISKSTDTTLRPAPAAAPALALLLTVARAQKVSRSKRDSAPGAALRTELSEKAYGLFCWATCIRTCLLPDLRTMVDLDSTHRYRSAQQVDKEFMDGWEKTASGMVVP
eukprot:SAG31_NODE_21947_length_537_cov_1.036530_1_plen_179_part_11